MKFKVFSWLLSLQIIRFFLIISIRFFCFYKAGESLEINCPQKVRHYLGAVLFWELYVEIFKNLTVVLHYYLA